MGACFSKPLPSKNIGIALESVADDAPLGGHAPSPSPLVYCNITRAWKYENGCNINTSKVYDGAYEWGGHSVSALDVQHNIAHPVYDTTTQKWTYKYTHLPNTNGACWDKWGGDNDGSVQGDVGDGAYGCVDGSVRDDGGTGAVGDGTCGCVDGSVCDCVDSDGSVQGDDGTGAVGDGACGCVDSDGSVWDDDGTGVVGDGACGSESNNIIDGINMSCSCVDDKVPKRAKAYVMKQISDAGYHERLTDNTLIAIDSGTLLTLPTLLSAWLDPRTPLVLKCIIADIFHRHRREKELGPLPDFYIVPHKQAKGKGGGKKSKQPVKCPICENRRSGECYCCTKCKRRTGSCVCKKECTESFHKCCTCTECGNILCNCTCSILEFLSFLSLWSL
jgi:hypothetical protein